MVREHSSQEFYAPYYVKGINVEKLYSKNKNCVGGIVWVCKPCLYVSVPKLLICPLCMRPADEVEVVPVSEADYLTYPESMRDDYRD